MFSDKPLIITGMHRSGTSLLANVFQDAGVSIGEVLMPAGEDNPNGFFEDQDFVRFHDEVIWRMDPAGIFLWEPHGRADLSKSELSAARELVENRSSSSPWAWKDPRTVLFLDLWREVVPDASFLFVFRRPDLVVESLRRRGDRRLIRRLVGKSLWPGKGRLGMFRFRRAISAWTLYNQRILDFVEKNPERSCLIEIDSLLADSDRILNHVQLHLGIPLEPIELSEIYDPGLMNTQSSLRVVRMLQRYPEVMEIYERLKSVAAK